MNSIEQLLSQLHQHDNSENVVMALSTVEGPAIILNADRLVLCTSEGSVSISTKDTYALFRVLELRFHPERADNEGN